MTRLLIALAIAVALSLFMPLMLEWRSAAWFGWRVEIPPLPKAAPQLHAAGEEPDTECVLWADIKPWAITRCESWEDETVCYIATSGFLQCFKPD